MKSHRNKGQHGQNVQQYQKNIQTHKNLALILKSYQKQMHEQQQIQKCYQQYVRTLEEKLQVVKHKFNTSENLQINSMIKSQQAGSSIKQNVSSVKYSKQQQTNGINLKPTSQGTKSVSQIKYINTFKFNDLKQELQTVFKILFKIHHQSKTNTNSMPDSKLFTNPNLIKSKLFSPQKVKPHQNDASILKEQSHSLLKEKPPLVTILNSQDQILSNLCRNMVKEEHLFSSSLQNLQNIQLEQILTKQLRSLTLKNETQIYGIKSNQKQKEEQEIQKRKNIIKFGYTQQMKQIIRKKQYRQQHTKQ